MSKKDLQIPTLITKRLRLEPLSFAHSDGMYALWSQRKVVEYSGVVNDYDGNNIPMPVENSTQSDLIIDFWNRATEDGWGFRWAIIEVSPDGQGEERFLGIIGFNSLKEAYEIAYHLNPTHWGQGIMSEASKPCATWAKDHGAKSIEAFVEPENKGSIALAERLGLQMTGEISEGACRYALVL